MGKAYSEQWITALQRAIGTSCPNCGKPYKFQRLADLETEVTEAIEVRHKCTYNHIELSFRAKFSDNDKK